MRTPWGRISSMGSPPDIHQAYIGLVEHIEVPLFERRALDPERVRRLHGRQLFRKDGILDPLPHLVAPEIVGRAVRPLIQQDVGKRAYPEVEPALLPHRLIMGISLLGRDIEGGLLPARNVETAESVAPLSIDFRIFALHFILCRPVEFSLLHGQREDGRTLKDGQMGRVLGRLLDDLHTARACANDSHALALEAQPLLRPKRGVMTGAGESFESLVGWNVGLRRKAGTENEIFCARHAAIGHMHVPASGCLVEIRRHDTLVETNAAAEIEHLVHVVKITPEFVPGRKALCPIPVAPDLFDRIFIDGHMGVDASARIAVPVPDPPQISRRIV